jgi:hypothetical protein
LERVELGKDGKEKGFWNDWFGEEIGKGEFMVWDGGFAGCLGRGEGMKGRSYGVLKKLVFV